MKKFTIHGSGEDFGNILAHIVAEDQTKAYAVANQVYCGTDCGWDMFPGWIIDCDGSAHISRPHQFLELVKKSLEKPDKFPHMVAGRVMRNNYVRWYGENLEIINGMASGFIQEVTPVEMDLMQARSRIRELEAALAIRQEHDWSEGSPRMKPGSLGFHLPVVPDLPVKTNDFDSPSLDTDKCYPAYTIEQGGRTRLEQKADGTVSIGTPVSDDPKIHTHTVTPELFGLYLATKEVSGNYSFDIRMDSWRTTVYTGEFTKGLANFFQQYPGEVLSVIIDDKVAIWFAEEPGHAVYTVNAFVHPKGLGEAAVIEIVKASDCYQRYAKMLKEFKETLK